MPKLLGLTGSIGMGKTTTARIFADEGLPVWDADAAVHMLYAKGGRAVPLVTKEFPNVIHHGAVDRKELRKITLGDDTAIKKLEKIVHPLVADDRMNFISNHSDAVSIVLDIPLLFETGADKLVDFIAVVSAPREIQRARVLARPEMTVSQFELIEARQLPDAQKRKRADYIIDTTSLDSARHAVQDIVLSLAEVK